MRRTNFRDNILIKILKTKVDDLIMTKDIVKNNRKKTGNILLISEHKDFLNSIFSLLCFCSSFHIDYFACYYALHHP
jgi:hypothetical protein